MNKTVIALIIVAALAFITSGGDMSPLKRSLERILPQSEHDNYSIESTENQYTETTEFETPETTEVTVQDQTNAAASNPTEASIETTEPTSEELTDGTELNLSVPYEVVKVVDGDTFDVNINGATERVRMIGIDTPESVHKDQSRNTEEGALVSDFMKDYLEGQSVYLEFDVGMRDKYDRLLAYAYLDDVMLNKMLLETGYARVMTIQPNVKYSDDFVELQRQAKNNEQGFWKDFFN